MIDISKISTEIRNENTKNIDIITTKRMIELINNEDKTVAFAVEKSIDQITKVVDVVTQAFLKGGRLFYVGAGTSGRLGVLDASECPPTFGVSPNMIIGIVAGGDYALRHAVEGVEDLRDEGASDLASYDLNQDDIVIGIAASGRTPYVLGGISYAKRQGITTCCITTSLDSELARLVDYPIEVITGPEPLTGSTRMKSGTAQKMVLNMISTTTMIKIGKVYENSMIDVQMSNLKLFSRATRIVMDITGVSQEEAERKLKDFDSVKYAIFSILTKIDDVNTIKDYFQKSQNNFREAIQQAKLKNQ